MKNIKAFFITSLLAVLLAIAGCSTTETYDEAPEDTPKPARSESGEARGFEVESILNRKQESGSDDMGRMD